MPTQDNITTVINYIKDNLSTKTTSQQYNYFLNNDLITSLIYSFPLIVENFGKGHVLAFESLLSKQVVLKTKELMAENENFEMIMNLSKGKF
jgi:hypothetical protein